MRISLKSALATGVLAVGTLVIGHATPILGPTGHYYELVVREGVAWNDADAAANASSHLGLSGHLVTLTSEAEDDFVLDMVYAWQDANLVGVTQPSEFWAGGFQDPLTEPDPKKGWTWVNGEGPIPGDNLGPGYANWATSGEPNDAHGTGSEPYLGLGLKDFITPATWNDESIEGYIAGYVVEYERTGVPEAGTTIMLMGIGLLGLAVSRRKLA